MAQLSAHATDRHWTGTISGDWSLAANWNPAGVPQNGDNLIFDSNARAVMTNSIAHLTVNNLSFPQSGDFFLYGEALTFSGLILNPNGTGTLTVNCTLIAQPGAQISASTTASSPDTTAKLYLNQPIVNSTGVLHLIVSDNVGSSESSGFIYCRTAISGTGDVSAETYGNGSRGKIEFDASQVNSVGERLFVQTAGPGIYFNASPDDSLFKDVWVVNGNTAKINIASNAIAFMEYSTVVLTSGGKLQLSAARPPFGVNSNILLSNLVMTNSPGETLPSTLDTGTNTLMLYSDLTTWCDNGVVTPTVKGAIITRDGRFSISGNGYAGLDMQAHINSGYISKTGNAALILETNNPNTGFDIDQGVVDVRNNDAIGNFEGYIALNGGSLTLRNVTIGGAGQKTPGLLVNAQQALTPDTTGSFITAIGTCKWLLPINLDQGGLYVIANDLTLGGQILGPYGLELSYGNVTFANSATNNTYTGTTFVHCPEVLFNNAGRQAYAGPLVVGGGNLSTMCEARWQTSQQGSGGGITVYSNGLVNLNGFHETIANLTVAGGHVETGNGQLLVNSSVTGNAANFTGIIDGNLALAGGVTIPFTIADGNADPDLVINAAISGAPTQLQKLGPGTMTLTGVNSYTGLTVVGQGVLEADTAFSLGNVNSPNTVQVQSNATCRLAGGGTFSKIFALSGPGSAGTNGALEFAVNSSCTVSSALTLAAPASVGVDQSAGGALNGVISGTGPLTKTGPGVLSFGGNSANTYAGDTVIQSGIFYLAKPFSVYAVPGNLVIGPALASSPASAVLLQSAQIGGDTVTVDANSTFNVNGFNEIISRLNLNDGGDVQTGAGILSFSQGGSVAVGSLSIFGSRAGSTISGNIGLPANDTLTFSVNRFNQISVPAPTGSELEVPAFIPSPVENAAFSPAGIAKSGGGEMHLTANNVYKGATIISAGTLRVDGSQPRSSVLVDGGTLSGIGTVGHLYPEGALASISPGAGPGILTCSNFNSGASGPGALRIELNGTTAGTDYDQLNVHGTVNLAGITLNASLNYASAVGDQFVVINNDGTDPVTGTFAGIPGKKHYIGKELFQVNYSGGTGNDVVLTRLVTPPPPTLAIQRLLPASVRLLWLTNDPPFSLQASTNLLGTNWAAALPLPIVVGATNVVVVPATNTQVFYRLAYP